MKCIHYIDREKIKKIGKKKNLFGKTEFLRFEKKKYIFEGISIILTVGCRPGDAGHCKAVLGRQEERATASIMSKVVVAEKKKGVFSILRYNHTVSDGNYE